MFQSPVSATVVVSLSSQASQSRTCISSAPSRSAGQFRRLPRNVAADTRTCFTLAMTVVEPLSAPIELSFDYTRSLGPTLSRFMTGLARRTICGARASDGRVYVPPLEYDPLTGVALTDFVEVADRGEVVSWTWAPAPLPGQPGDRPFAWVLVKLDGADTALLHALAVESPAAVATGMRVRAQWADAPVGAIRDIVCFVPENAPPAAFRPMPATTEPVTMVTTPVSLRVQHSASIQETRYLLALEEGRLVGQRCPDCRKVYIPPRGA